MASGMVYLHAVMLLHYAGKEINEENIKNVLQAAGITNYEEGYIKAIVSAVSKVDLNQIVEQAKQAPVAAAVAAAPTTAAPAEEAEKKEEKKEEKKKEEKKEEESLAGLAALFG